MIFYYETFVIKTIIEQFYCYSQQACGIIIQKKVIYMNQKLKQLREKAMNLPLSPGVYIMKNKAGEIIYIGKAKALKNRVSQYFGSDRNHPEKVRRMVSNVDDFDYILTSSEFEALVLECSLIKQHKPKYNILLKDDKGYSYIRISNEDWCKITHVMQKNNDGATYIGPYISSWFVKNAVEEARKIFKIPSCNKCFPRDFRKSRPCLNYYIKQCCAPCKGNISLSDYRERVDSAISFLRNGNTDSIAELEKRMEAAADNLDFELAAKLRDRISAIKRMSDKQTVIATRIAEQDIIALMQEGNDTCFSVLRFDKNRLFDKEDFLLSDIGSSATARSEFINRYYSMRDKVPPIIAIDGEVESAELIEMWLSELANRRVHIHIPQKGEQMRLIELAKKNAAEKLAQNRGHKGSDTSALGELAELLGLKKVPEFIESYDISNLSGSFNVAGMVVFKNGRPYKTAYRRFQIKSFVGQDDYASMAEVIERRFKEYELHKGEEGFGTLPDLILLDGGKGQVSAVRPVLEKMGYGNIPLFGMVKDDKHRTRAITSDGGEISITSKRSTFTLVSTIQDEVHRFAIGYMRASNKKKSFTSSLTSIDGIGETRAKALLKFFKTIKRISEADVEELMNAPTMTRPAAEAVYKHFHSQD